MKFGNLSKLSHTSQFSVPRQQYNIISRRPNTKQTIWIFASNRRCGGCCCVPEVLLELMIFCLLVWCWAFFYLAQNKSLILPYYARRHFHVGPERNTIYPLGMYKSIPTKKRLQTVILGGFRVVGEISFFFSRYIFLLLYTWIHYTLVDRIFNVSDMFTKLLFWDFRIALDL